MRKNLQHINFKQSNENQNTLIKDSFLTSEGIEIKQTYSKKDIEDLDYGLNEILALSPKAYHWKNREQSYKSLGLIAQEVQPIINEIVHVAEDKDKTLSVSYTELIPVLIKAIQEQQTQIDNQNATITTQESKINDLSTALEHKNRESQAFDTRLKHLELLLKSEKL